MFNSYKTFRAPFAALPGFMEARARTADEALRKIRKVIPSTGVENLQVRFNDDWKYWQPLEITLAKGRSDKAAEYARQCVIACEGMKDPVGDVRFLKEKLEEYVRMQKVQS